MANFLSKNICDLNIIGNMRIYNSMGLNYAYIKL